MKSAYGFVKWGIQAAKGTAAPSLLPTGILSNARVTARSGMERLYSVGGVNAVELSEGMAVSDVSVAISALQHAGLISQIERTGGELPWLTFRLGYDRGTDQYYEEVIDCKMNTLALRIARGGRVSADIECVGGKVSKTDGDPGTMSFPGEKAYRYFEAQWSEAYDLLSFELRINNNLEAVPVIAGSGTTRDPERIWDFLDEGGVELDGTVEYFVPMAGQAALDAHACLIAGGNKTLTLTGCSDVSPSQSIAIAITNLTMIDDEFDLPQGGDVVLRVPYWATGFNIT